MEGTAFRAPTDAHMHALEGRKDEDMRGGQDKTSVCGCDEKEPQVHRDNR